MKVKRFMSAIRAINFLIGMTIHFGMEIMLQILTEVVLFYIFVQKNVRKNIRVVLTAVSSKVTYNTSLRLWFFLNKKVVINKSIS